MQGSSLKLNQKTIDNFFAYVRRQDGEDVERELRRRIEQNPDAPLVATLYKIRHEKREQFALP